MEASGEVITLPATELKGRRVFPNVPVLFFKRGSQVMAQKNSRRNFPVIVTVLLSLFVTGCHLHSPFQEELAKDIQTRYKLVSPSAIQALEVLDSDMDKLLDSQRADFELYRETSEQVLLNMKWGEYKQAVKTLEAGYFENNGDEKGVVAQVRDGIKTEECAIKDLQLEIDKLGEVVTSLNKALKKAEEKTSLSEELDEVKGTITAAIKAIHTVVSADPNTPLAKRLSASVGEIDKYIKQLSENEKSKGNRKRVFSLVVEAMRLGRDIAALELEVVEQEQSYHERVLALYKAEKKILPIKKELENMRGRYGDPEFPEFPDAHRFSNDEMIRERLGILARQISQDEEKASASEQVSTDQSQAEARARRICANKNRETMRQILDDIARYQAINLTNEQRVKELELRRASEKYRNAKLKDVIFERQRITLISYGLDGVVRYSESGLRAQDIASLINIARMVAEFIIAARV